MAELFRGTRTRNEIGWRIARAVSRAAGPRRLQVDELFCSEEAQVRSGIWWSSRTWQEGLPIRVDKFVARHETAVSCKRNAVRLPHARSQTCVHQVVNGGSIESVDARFEHNAVAVRNRRRKAEFGSWMLRWRTETEFWGRCVVSQGASGTDRGGFSRRRGDEWVICSGRREMGVVPT